MRCSWPLVLRVGDSAAENGLRAGANVLSSDPKCEEAVTCLQGLSVVRARAAVLLALPCYMLECNTRGPAGVTPHPHTRLARDGREFEHFT